jgi:hypothetical protein
MRSIQHARVQNSMNRISHNIKFRTCQHEAHAGNAGTKLNETHRYQRL